MQYFPKLTASLLLLVLHLPVDAAPAPQIPLRDFFRNPEKANFTLSPDGHWLAFLQPWEQRLNVFVQSVAGGQPVRVTSETARDIAWYFWKGNDHLVYVKDFGGDENFHLLVTSRDGKQQKDLTPFAKVRAEIVNSLPESDTELLVSLNKRKAEIFDVYRASVQTGVLTLIAENPGNITGWVADHHGQIRAASTSDGVNTSFLFRKRQKDPWKTIVTTNFREGFATLFFDAENRYIYASSNLKRDKTALVKVDPTTGKEIEIVYENPSVDMGYLGYSDKRKVITCAYFVTWKSQHHCLDTLSAARFTEVERQLPGNEINFLAHNRAETLWIVQASSDRDPGTVYLYDDATKKLTKLAELYPWLDAEQLAEMKPVSYQTRDGLSIQAYLTLPKGGGGQKLPVVVNPHGGPWARDAWGYNPEVQFLANRGYAVFQMNFRGSTGYGRKFWEASFKEWGKKMQHDITDGVQFLIDQGIADPKRVATYGASYGGYATLAGITFTPDLYACAVDYASVANLFTFLKTIPPYWKPYRDMFHEMVGDPDKDRLLLQQASPVCTPIRSRFRSSSRRARRIRA